MLSFGFCPKGVAEVAQRHEGLSPKCFDSAENFKPLHTIFCREIKICRDLRNFWKTLGKKGTFLGKNCTITWYILHIVLNYIFKFVITCQNDAFVLKIANMRLTKNFVAVLPLTKGCQLLPPWSKLPPPSPQFGQLVQPFSTVEIQYLKVSLGLYHSTGCLTK